MTTKLVWHSNAPFAPTGYGNQTGLFAPLIAQNYDTAISAFYGLEGSPITWQDIPVLPGMGGNHYGDEFLVQHAKYFFGGNPRDGIVITLLDVWVLDPRWMQQVNAACWVPVDHDPAPPGVTQFFEASGCLPIAMSKFGREMLAGFDPLYVPHGVDTSKFKPRDSSQVRREVGVSDDAFLIGMVAANKGRPSRKGFVQAFQAFAKFSETHDNAYLYLHTMVNPGLAAGEDIPALLSTLGVPQNRVLIADQYRTLFNPYSPEAMSKIYSAMDVLLNPSMGEGFGITVLEAAACGTPAIVTDFSAMREVCGVGWHVKHTPYWSGLNSWQATPDVDDIVAALEECAGRTGQQRVKMAAQARKHALGYDVHRVWKEHMQPTLATVEKHYADRAPVAIVPQPLKAAA